MVSGQWWKCMLPNGNPKPCKPDPMRNGSEIIKDISRFFEYWKKLYEEDITKCVWDTHEPMVAYWDHICSALLTFGVDTCTTMTQGFWPQRWLIVVEYDVMFFKNANIREKFAMDEHHVGPVRNVPLCRFIWFLIAMRVIWSLYM